MRFSACTPQAPQCNQGLSCYRTDLARDEGVCAMGQVCTRDGECGGGEGRICATSLARALFGVTSPVNFDSLHCIQTGCAQRNLPCPGEEVCLPHEIPPESAPPDICVPRCTGPEMACPLNYFCLRKVSGPQQPNICLPGMPGFRCSSHLDCLLGECIDTGEGFRVCSTPCTSHDDCGRAGGLREEMVCSLRRPDGRSYCARVGAFDGAFCARAEDCGPGELCARSRPRDSSLCRRSCTPGQSCPDRGGMPQACVDWFGPPVCVPATFGLPCSADRRCVGLHDCVTGAVLDGQDQLRTQPICSRRCRLNEDCLDDRTIGRLGGWCERGVCAPRRTGGQLCTAPIECESSVCEPSRRPEEGGTGVLRCGP